MQYFCLENEREGTCYHEFYRGKWHEMDFWNPNSLLIHEDILEETKLYKAFSAAISTYDCCGETEVTSKDWCLIREYTKAHLGENAQEALNEIEYWINDVFGKEGLFTIIGI